MEKLAPSNITDALNAHQTYAILVETISKRMSYIIEFCLKTCNGRLEWWDWHNEKEFPSAYGPDIINITGEWVFKEKMDFIDKYGKEQSLEYGYIPTRWLYEDFEDEFVNGIKLLQEQKKEKARKDTEKQQKKKQAKEELLASLKSKLTPEELKVLKL